MEKTICAISTPIGVGGISIIRMSGEKSLEILRKILNDKDFTPIPRRMHLKSLCGENFSDEVMVVYFPCPNSYTGEDMVEIHCHGGIYITNAILTQLISLGATLAENGEFSKRAFINGKMTLDRLEGVIDMINAESEEQGKSAYKLLKGELSKKVFDFQDTLTDILAEIEVSLDYPEMDIEIDTLDKFLQKVEKLKNEISTIKNTSDTGMIIKNGINIAILGAPNVGKSSLMNALLGYERAIVTNLEGTTRDTICESYIYNGIKVNLIDTAGIRESDNEVEKIGIELSLEKINTSDLILFVVDSSRKLTEEEKNLYDKIKDKKHILVVNKIDKKQEENFDKFSPKIEISTTKNTNIQNLKQLIFDTIIGNKIANNSTIITNTRHKIALENAEKSLIDAINTLKSTENLELFSIDLQNAYSSLGEITGTSSKENIIDRIFAKFCLGK